MDERAQKFSTKSQKTTGLDAEEGGQISFENREETTFCDIFITIIQVGRVPFLSQFYYCPSRGVGNGFLLLPAEDEFEKHLPLSFRPNDWAITWIS